MGYLEGNTSLPIDVLTMIDLVKLKLEYILKIDVITLDNTKCYNDDIDEKGVSLAMALLHALNEAEYCCLRSEFIDVNVNFVPSHYPMTKRRPDMTS